MDGKKSLVLTSDAPRANTRQRPRALAIRCSGGDLDLLFDAGEVLEQSSPDRVEIRVRYDTASARTVRGNRSTSYHAIFFDDPRPHVRSLLKTKTALVEFTPFTRGPIVAEFDVAGLKDYFDLLKRHCRF